MKTCFSEGKLTKQFGTLLPFKRILPFHDPLFVQISKTEKPHLILGGAEGEGKEAMESHCCI